MDKCMVMQDSQAKPKNRPTTVHDAVSVITEREGNKNLKKSQACRILEQKHQQ